MNYDLRLKSVDFVGGNLKSKINKLVGFKI